MSKMRRSFLVVFVEWDTPPSSPKQELPAIFAKQDDWELFVETPEPAMLEQKKELVDLAVALQKAMAIATPQEIKTVVAAATIARVTMVRRRQRRRSKNSN